MLNPLLDARAGDMNAFLKSLDYLEVLTLENSLGKLSCILVRICRADADFFLIRAALTEYKSHLPSSDYPAPDSLHRNIQIHKGAGDGNRFWAEIRHRYICM